jgi:hypothetical protein
MVGGCPPHTVMETKLGPNGAPAGQKRHSDEAGDDAPSYAA